MIKKLTLLSAFVGLTGAAALAQNAKLVTVNPSTVDAASSNYTARQIGTPNQTQALFDVQFNYNATDSSNGRTGMAGVVFTGTEFWVSRWASDSIHTFSPAGALTGSFTVPSVTGIRALTWDGTNIYAGVNTTSIKIINPITKTLTGTITSAAPGITVRHITYDSTANGGAGGFWIGNFGTNIAQISMTGAVLQTINAATHGLTGMYGSAIDHWTAGGPYLWIFDQGGTSQARLVRLQLPAGTPTGLTHDVATDVGTLPGITANLAGGLCIAHGLAATRTIVGINQGTPDNLLFGYELNDFIQPAVDAKLQSLEANTPNISYPLVHYTSPILWAGTVSNEGSSTLTSTSFVVNVMNGPTPVYNNTTTVNNLAPATSAVSVTSAGLSATTTGTFSVKAYASVDMPQSDLVHANDTMTYNYAVTDTVFALENGISTGSLGIGNGTGGTLGQIFTTSVADQISSVTLQLNAPTEGDSMRVSIHSFGAQPGAVLASTAYYKFVGADTNGVVLTLPLIGGPLPVNAGTYFVGVNEVSANVTLATTDFNFHTNSSWVIFGTNPWAPAENYGFNKTFLLRMNIVGAPVGIKTNSLAEEDLSVYPNPASNHLTVELDKNTTRVSVVNILGEEIYHTAVGDNVKKLTLDLSAVPSGIYFVKADANGKVRSSKVVVSK